MSESVASATHICMPLLFYSVVIRIITIHLFPESSPFVNREGKGWNGRKNDEKWFDAEYRFFLRQMLALASFLSQHHQSNTRNYSAELLYRIVFVDDNSVCLVMLLLHCYYGYSYYYSYFLHFKNKHCTLQCNNVYTLLNSEKKFPPVCSLLQPFINSKFASLLVIF